MFVLLSTLHDFIDACRAIGRQEIYDQDFLSMTPRPPQPPFVLWVQDELTELQLPYGNVVTALTCSAQCEGHILIWRSVVEKASWRTPEKAAEISAAAQARLDTAKAILTIQLHVELTAAVLRSGILLEPGMLAEVPTFTGQQHLWLLDQENGLSTRKLLRRGDHGHAAERVD